MDVSRFPDNDLQRPTATHALSQCASHRGRRRCPSCCSCLFGPRLREPIPLPRCRHLVTLEDAAAYHHEIAEAEQASRRMADAIGCLIGAAEAATSYARSHRHVEALNRTSGGEFDSSRKATHWGRRKLAMDR